MEDNKLVLDLETKKTFEEVGGDHNKEQLGVSLVGVYSYQKDQFKSFREEEFKELGEWLKKASLIIGFNSKSFDFTVLQPYFKFKLAKLPHLDILEEIYHALGHRLKLESVVQCTLGEGKSGSGLDAVWYYKNNEWENLEKYCLDDVRITRDLYEYGKQHGHIWYEKMGDRVSIPVRWGNGTSIKDQVLDAYRNGEQIEIEYLKAGFEERSVRKIDIKIIKNNQVHAFCHLKQTSRIFNIDKIITVKSLGKQDNWQSKLF
ncbi:ribonuclease H-like domain-containing protein [Patescibacteria group bacterium]|nr:ribonuclease H-like domain-containing protein [Patescibacteria group bacterium]